MFCQNCGNEINEGSKFCPNCGNATGIINNTTKDTVKENVVEIQGDFPIAQSKIPLELLEGEQLILQYNVAIISKLAANGILSLTNKRTHEYRLMYVKIVCMRVKKKKSVQVMMFRHNIEHIKLMM